MMKECACQRSYKKDDRPSGGGQIHVWPTLCMATLLVTGIRMNPHDPGAAIELLLGREDDIDDLHL